MTSKVVEIDGHSIAKCNILTQIYINFDVTMFRKLTVFDSGFYVIYCIFFGFVSYKWISLVNEIFWG